MPNKKSKHAHPHPHPVARPLWMTLAIIVAGLAGLVGFCSWADAMGPRFHKFDRPKLLSVVQQSLEKQRLRGGENATILIGDVINGVYETFPDIRVRTDYLDKSEWFWNNAGGAMGSMFVLHASMTEYLIIFGSSLGTEGHTGRHTADDYFHILAGEQIAQSAGDLQAEVYRPGDVHHLKRGTVKQYRFVGECWALEYAVGWIPLMLPFGLADTMFSTLDFETFYHTTRITGREIIANLLRGKI